MRRRDFKYLILHHMFKVRGLRTPIRVACCQCQKSMVVVERSLLHPMKKHYLCSKTCASHHARSFVPPGKISQGVKRWLAQNYELKKRACKFCGVEIPLLDRVKFCSNLCRVKSKHEGIAANRLYRLRCQFKFSLNSYPDEFDFALIEAHGWYSAKNRGGNLTGVTRDHMYSVAEGFRKGVDPAIVAHPANCKLMLFTDNYRKRGSSSISLETLLERISAWDAKYPTLLSSVQSPSCVT